TGEIDAKLWDVSTEDVNTFKDGTIVKVTGDINEFRGKAQMRVKAIRPAQTTDGVKVSDFLEKAPVDKTDLQEQVNAAIFAMEKSEEHTSELQSRFDLVCRLLLEKKKKRKKR